MMNQIATDTLNRLTHALQNQPLVFNRGIEREALRVDPAGNLAKTPHPAAFGSKLTHPRITTDFSESQLELITGVSQSGSETLDSLEQIHRAVYQDLEDEILWSASMPCVLQGDPNIPLAYYGESNLGRLKTTYRNGLGNRYGRSMQTICAVHYNFSLPESFWRILSATENATYSDSWRSARYFDLMRNFRRFSWLPLFLFGASPAVCKSFVKGREHHLDVLDEGTLYLPGATSLRSGDLGYNSSAQRDMVNVCYNSLDNYVSTLAEAIVTPYADYQAIGVEKDGQFLQVSDNVLQSEAEFYTTVRAKCVPGKGENFLSVLKKDGVQYIEVRLLDVNPYLPLGIDATEINFLDCFLLTCLLLDSPEHCDALCASVSENQALVVAEGQHTDLRLNDITQAPGSQQRSLAEWAKDVLQTVQQVAAWLDGQTANKVYTTAVQQQLDKVNDPSLVPSARILTDMREQKIPYFRFAMNKALEHQAFFRANPLSPAEQAEYRDMAAASVAEQQQIEAQPQLPFDTYLKNLIDQYRQL
ncbi:MAG: glutamate--cysteine ligase [Pseudomonadales bacterium]|nr:glutamate--cysteine ligase [Pseudomonadales bacterium]